MTEKFIRTIKEVSGKIITYKQEEVLLSNGNMATRDIVLHDGAVGIVAITKENEIILVRQYRYAAGEDLYEIPAGKLEKGRSHCQRPSGSFQRKQAIEQKPGII